MHRIASGLAALSLVACTATQEQPPCDVPAVADRCGGSFSLHAAHWDDGELAWFGDAAGRWDAFAGSSLVSIGEHGTCRIVSRHLPAGTLSSYDAATGEISIDRVQVAEASAWNVRPTKLASEREGGLLIAVVMHQVGHSLGFSHADGALAFTNAGGGFSPADRAQCNELGWCSE